jgi:hypothetical protein
MEVLHPLDFMYWSYKDARQSTNFQLQEIFCIECWTLMFSLEGAIDVPRFTSSSLFVHSLSLPHVLRSRRCP